MILVAFASYDTELFVAYSSSVSPLEACTRAEALSRSLKTQIPQLSSQIL
jgi:hypothetical protein